MLNKNLSIAAGIVLSAVIVVLGAGALGPVAADDDRHEREDRYERGEYRDRDGDDDHRGKRMLQIRPEIDPATHAAYVEECGACHMAYPAALLPAASWTRMMGSLDDHFGENAELDDATRQELQDYLTANSADNTDSYMARKMQRGAGNGDAPLRISELPYFRHEHDEIPMRMVKDNAKVGSFSRCEACHQDAAQGMFDEHRVNIPGYGRWDD